MSIIKAHSWHIRVWLAHVIFRILRKPFNLRLTFKKRFFKSEVTNMICSMCLAQSCGSVVRFVLGASRSSQYCAPLVCVLNFLEDSGVAASQTNKSTNKTIKWWSCSGHWVRQWPLLWNSVCCFVLSSQSRSWLFVGKKVFKNESVCVCLRLIDVAFITSFEIL